MKEKFFKKIFFSLLSIIFITSVNADDKMRLGLEVYNEKAMCGSCHILKEADSNGDIGPNLDQLKPQKHHIVYVVKNGAGVMPSFEEMLSAEEIEAVAHFISTSTDQ